MPSLSRARRLNATVVWQLAAIVVMAVLGAVVVSSVDQPYLAFGVVAVIGFAMLSLTFPAALTAVFLIVRPLLDKFNATHVAGINLAGALGLLLVIVMLSVLLTQRRHIRTRATVPFLFVFLVSLLAVVVAFVNYGSKAKSVPIGEMARLAAMLAIYVLCANLLAEPRGVRRVFTLVAFSGIVPALWGYAQLAGGLPHEANLGVSRIGGPFTGPNPLGEYLAVAAATLVALPREWISRELRIAGLAIMLPALVLTYSRGGWALFLIAVLAMAWRDHKRATAGIALVSVSLVMFVPTIHNRVLPPNKKSGGVETPASFQWRLKNWEGLLTQWEKRPFIGYGLATTPLANPQKSLDPEASNGLGGFAAHNTVVKLLVEGGVVLLLVWIGVIATLVGTMRRLARQAWRFSRLARATMMIWVAIIVVALSTDDPLASTAMMYAVLALTGSLEGAFALERRRKLREQPAAAATF